MGLSLGATLLDFDTYASSIGGWALGQRAYLKLHGERGPSPSTLRIQPNDISGQPVLRLAYILPAGTLG